MEPTRVQAMVARMPPKIAPPAEELGLGGCQSAACSDDLSGSRGTGSDIGVDVGVAGQGL